MLTYNEAFSSFSTSDIAAAKRFYGEVLGLQVEEQTEGLSIALEGGARVFIYYSTDNQAPDNTVLNFVVDNIDKAINELYLKGVSMEQYPEFHTDVNGICYNDGSQLGPKAIAWFKDPDGHVLSIIQRF